MQVWTYSIWKFSNENHNQIYCDCFLWRADKKVIPLKYIFSTYFLPCNFFNWLWNEKKMNILNGGGGIRFLRVLVGYVKRLLQRSVSRGRFGRSEIHHLLMPIRYNLRNTCELVESLGYDELLTITVLERGGLINIITKLLDKY